MHRRKSQSLPSYISVQLTIPSGAVVSLFTGGAFFGAMFAGPTCDYLGRRWTIAIGSIVFILGGALQTSAQGLSYLFSGRCFAGVGVGFLCMVIPLYQAEISHPSIRGRITALQQFMLGIGALVASWVSYGTFIGLETEAQWRVPLGIQLIPAVFLGALIFLFPESPRWLIDHGRSDEGLSTLARLHAHGNVNDPWVRAEFEQIQESITYEHEHEAKSYAELFTNMSCFRRLLIALALQASIQMTGVSAIQYYSVTIYGQIGISADLSLRYQAINSVIALIAQFLCILLIDKFGRRWTLIWGNLGNMITFIIATALLGKRRLYPSFSVTFAVNSTINAITNRINSSISSWKHYKPWCRMGLHYHVRKLTPLFISESSKSPYFNILCLCLLPSLTLAMPSLPEFISHVRISTSLMHTLRTWIYNFSFSATCGPLSWVIPAEIFDTRTRAKGVSLATMMSFAFNTMIGQVTPIAMAAVGWKYYIVFVVCNFTNALFFWAILPETKRIPLEEMNYLFTHAPWFVPGTDQSVYRAGMEEDVERRAREIKEKGGVVEEMHEEVVLG
jgi:MFS family permease